MVQILISCLTFLLTLIYVSVVLYFRKGWRKIPYFCSESTFSPVPVSVIIAARNEEDKIGKTINDILNQSYDPEFYEIIVIDDHSTDRTAEIVLSIAAPNVHLIKLNEDQPLNSYKKKAISEGIKMAGGELIITTDADCRMKSNWLKTIVSFYQQGGYKLISSPVVYFEEKNTFERLQTLEFLYLIGLGASSVGNKMPSTCNGANLAYQKSVFEELKGFQGIDDLASGDDELFLHKVASKYPGSIGFCKSEEALVYTHAKPDLKEFIRQRKRWASKSTRYKNKKIVALGVSIWLFNLLILINVVLGFFNSDYWIIVLLSLLLKYLTERWFLSSLTHFINRSKLLGYLPVLTIMHVFYMVYIGLAGNSGKYVWKGRMVK